MQYYEQTSDMMVDAVNENVKEDDDEEEEEEETEDGSMFEAMFDSEQENRQPVTNIRCVSIQIHSNIELSGLSKCCYVPVTLLSF